MTARRSPLISNFDKQDKMQLLTKFKKILYMGFRATLARVDVTRSHIFLNCSHETHHIIVLTPYHNYFSRRCRSKMLDYNCK